MSSTGSFYNNGVINKKFAEGELIPEGWVKGMKPRSEEEKAKSSEKRKQTNLKKYGVENTAQVREFQEKAKQTSLERYGTENPAQSQEIKDKIKEVNLNKYGVESYSQTEEFQVKKTQTMLNRYGVEHAVQSKEIQEKTKQTNLRRYGVEHALQSPIVQEKVKQTNLERRGVEWAMQSKEVQEKSKQTTLQNWGVENVSQSEEIKQLKKETTLNNYGVENPSQSDVVKQYKIDTSLEHYGVENPTQSPEVREKTKQTNLKNLGVECPFQSEECKAKARQTSLDKYGYEYATQSPEVKKKTKQTNLIKYGYESPAQSPIIKQAVKDNFLEIYGVTNPQKLPSIIEKAKQTNLLHWGVDSYSKTPEFKERFKETSLERYGVDNPTKSPVVQKRVKQTNLERYGVEWFVLHPKYKNASHGCNSKPNLDFASLLDELGISYEREFTLGVYSYDFKVGNTLVEINPWPTHNILWNPFTPNHESRTNKDYHNQKSQTAIEAGYHCIHIFDWDSKEKIVRSLIQDKETIYARQTNISGITKQEAKEFLNEYHLQGSCNGQEVILGLRDKYGELVSLMSFGKPRYNKNYQYELLRYCYSKQVIGGAEKLFKHFIKQYKPESIISYCDNSKFSGNVYKKLGFVLKDIGSPSKHWYSPKTDVPLQHITDNLLRQRGYDQLFNESYGKGTSNEELIIKRGYVPIYDCGQSTYTWSK